MQLFSFPKPTLSTMMKVGSLMSCLPQGNPSAREKTGAGTHGLSWVCFRGVDGGTPRGPSAYVT